MDVNWIQVTLVPAVFISLGLILILALLALLKNRFSNRAINYPAEVAIERLKQGFWLPATAYAAASLLGAAGYFASMQKWNWVLGFAAAGFVIIELGGMSHALTWRTERRGWLTADAQTLASNLEHAFGKRQLLSDQEFDTIGKTIERERIRLKNMPKRGPDSLYTILDDSPNERIPRVLSKDFLTGKGIFGSLTTSAVVRGGNKWGYVTIVLFVLTASYLCVLAILGGRTIDGWLLFSAYICLAGPMLYMALRGHLIGDAHARVLLSLDLDHAERLLQAMKRLAIQSLHEERLSRLRRLQPPRRASRMLRRVAERLL